MELTGLTRWQDRATKWGQYFGSGPWSEITASRSAYRMEVEDEAKRTALGLSAIGSTKSMAAVDHFVENALVEYEQDRESLSFIARAIYDPMKEEAARVLSQIFQYRRRRTFPFFTWHRSSLLAGSVDGLECAFVSWVFQSYTKDAGFRYIDSVSGMEVSPQMAEHPIMKGRIRKEPVKVTVKARDTFWIDLLEPGKNIMWDPSIPIMDINLGTWVIVKLSRNADQLKAMVKAGILDLLTEEQVDESMKGKKADNTYADSGKVAVDPSTIDFGNGNNTDLWCCFENRGGQWLVSFSLRGEIEASSEKDMNDVFYRGRPVNILPAVVGLTKPRLWESLGYGLPNVIAPLEKEWRDHRNNVNDIAKEIVQGKIRLDPSSNANINDILNRRAFRAEQGEVEFIKRDYGMLETMRAGDLLQSEMASLLPSGINGQARGVVPKGTDQTLGATQLALHDQDEKTGVSLMTRNETFLEKVLYLIGQNIICYESDETILKVAGKRAGIEHLPFMAPTMQGPVPDIRAIDIEFDVQINAGLGAMPRYKKGQAAMQIGDWRKTHGIPTDMEEIAGFVNITAGFDRDDFTPKTPPPPPEPQWEAKVEIPWSEIPPQAKMMMLQNLAAGAVGGKANVKDDSEMQARLREQMHNGGGMMTADRTGKVVDATGDEAMRMGDAARQRHMTERHHAA